MTQFKDLHEKLLNDSLSKKNLNERTKLISHHKNQYDLNCLLNPDKNKCSSKLETFKKLNAKQYHCIKKNLLEESDRQNIQHECGLCGESTESCKIQKLRSSKDIIPAIKAIHESKGLVYAMIAPAFLGQFSETITPGKLRSAFKYIGFDGMIEVALFADILTLKEALEFDKNINTEKDFHLTSCCCPIWINMMRKSYNDLIQHIPGSVSPMIACGRAIKQLHPDATTIFIGPCVAKKAEAREKDLIGAVDFVLTFQEMQSIFEAIEVDPDKMPDLSKDHSSRAGRIYARSGGISEAVQKTVKRLNPNRKITIKTKQADGVPACKEMLNDLISGKSDANFFEGMGCHGGCVGGPKIIIDKDKGKNNVDKYGDNAIFDTPIDNPYVIELLHRLGFDTIESLLDNSDIFTRKF